MDTCLFEMELILNRLLARGLFFLGDAYEDQKDACRKVPLEPRISEHILHE